MCLVELPFPSDSTEGNFAYFLPDLLVEMTPTKEALEKELENYTNTNNKSAIRAAINAGRYNNAARLLTPRLAPGANQLNVTWFRNRVGYHMAQPPKYNNSKINLKKGNNATPYLKRAWNSGKLTNIIVPHLNWKNRGPGVTPSSLKVALNNTKERWAFVNRNTGNVRAFGLGQIEPSPANKKHISLHIFAAFPSYGAKLLNRIKENVNRIELSSTANNFYRKQNFKGGNFASHYVMSWNKS